MRLARRANKDRVRAMKTEDRAVYVAYTNTDLTEGRGNDVPVAVCEVRSTAIRLAKRIYVMGSDGPVRRVAMELIGREWFIPLHAVPIIYPSKEDLATQSTIEAREAAVRKAKIAGLTDADIAALIGAKT